AESISSAVVVPGPDGLTDSHVASNTQLSSQLPSGLGSADPQISAFFTFPPLYSRVALVPRWLICTSVSLPSTPKSKVNHCGIGVPTFEMKVLFSLLYVPSHIFSAAALAAFGS